MAHYPNQAHQTDLANSYAISSEFVQAQMVYGKKMYASTLKAVPLLATSTIKEITKVFAEERRAIGKNSCFDTFRDESQYQHITHTPLFPRVGNQTRLEAILSSRYAVAYPYLQKTMEQLASSPLSSSGWLDPMKTCLCLGYRSKAGEVIPLTQTHLTPGSMKWSHSSNYDIIKILPEVDQLSQELAKGTLDKTKLLTGLWFICNITLTPRGTAQYSQNWLAAQFIQKGRRPPIPSKVCPPDLVAISTTLEQFLAQADSLYDYWDEANHP